MAGKLSNRVVRSMFWKLLPAQMLVTAAININGLLNSMIVGNLMGAEYLSVFGFVWPLTQIQAMLSGGIAVGSQILCGTFVGRGDKKGISRIYVTVSVLCVVIGAILTAVYAIFPVQIAAVLGASGNALNYTADYLRGLSWSMILTMFSSSMIPFLQLNNAQNVMYIAIGAMTAANIGGDLLSIRVFHAGMAGIGNAVSAGYVAFMLIVAIYYCSGRCGVRLNARDFSFRMIGDITRLGLPDMLMCLFIAIRTLVLNRAVLAMAGNLAMSAMAVISNLCSLVDIVTRGIEGSTSMEASLLYGERDKNSLREMLPILLRITGPMKAGCYALICVFAPLLARLFGVETVDVSYTATAIRLFMIFLLANIVFSIINNIYKGMGKTKLGIVIAVFNFLIVPIVSLLTFPKLFGNAGLWLAVPLEEVFTTVGLILYSAFKRGRFPKRLNELTYIPEEFVVDSRDRCDASIRSMAQISDISQRAIAFCRDKGMDDVRSNFCGLCVEEMSVAILEHGRERAARKPGRYEIDLRLIYENAGVSILLRDNYPPFNPLEWAKLQNPDDPARYIGVRMVTKMARTMVYSATVNLNVLMIRLDAQT